MADVPVLSAIRSLPGCVGLSVWRVDDDVASTVLAIDLVDDALIDVRPTDAALLDAVQFADCGPGTDVVDRWPVDGSKRETLFARWPLFATVAGGMGVRGTVAVPLHGPVAWRPGTLGVLHGVVVLYLSRPITVDGALVGLAEVIGSETLRGALPPGPPPVTPAHAAPGGLLLERELGLASGSGEGRLHGAAARAGITDRDLSDTLIDVLRG